MVARVLIQKFAIGIEVPHSAPSDYCARHLEDAWLQTDILVLRPQKTVIAITSWTAADRLSDFRPESSIEKIQQSCPKPACPNVLAFVRYIEACSASRERAGSQA